MRICTAVVPCYNEALVLPIFYRAFKEQQEKLKSRVELRALFINDGSKDDTESIMRQLANKDSTVGYLSFSRNFGKEAAILAGLEAAKGDLVVVMDADMQDPPALLAEMLDAIDDGYDCVAAKRVSRDGEPKVRSACARVFYRVMNYISDTEMEDGARDYRMMTRGVVDAVLQVKDKLRFTKGIYGWVGFKTKWLAYENIERAAGRTKWSFLKLFRYATEGFTAFTTTPLYLMSMACGIGGVLLVFYQIFLILEAMFSPYIRVTLGLVFFNIYPFLALLLFMAACLGLYLIRVLKETEDRPQYLIKEAKQPQESARED